MTKKNEEKGHDHLVLDLMRQFDLFAVDTRFKSKKKIWDDKPRNCNATYLRKHADKRPTKLDYFLVSNRRQAMVMDSTVKWGASIYRFGKNFDHGILAIKWAWRIRMYKGEPKPDYSAMTDDEKWSQFDVELKKALLKDVPEQPKVEVTEEEMFAQYGHLAYHVAETVKKVVPPKKVMKINGERVSEKTCGVWAEQTEDT